MRRILYITLLICIALTATVSCGQRNDNSGRRTVIAALRGPSSVAMIKLIDSLATAEGAEIEVRLFSEPMQVRKLMLEDSADLAVLPSTMAALLYNKGIDYRLAAVPLWGTLYLCGIDSTIKSLQDLKGRKVYLMDRGMTPDILFRHLLKKNGLKAYQDVEIDYRFPTHIDLANATIAGRADLSVISEPYLSQALEANPSLHLLIDLNEEWARAEGTPLAETALVCRGALAGSEQVAAIVEAYGRAAEWACAHPDSAAALAVKHGINPDSAAVVASIPRSNIKVVKAGDAHKALYDYLRVFEEMEPEVIGNKLPNEKFIAQ